MNSRFAITAICLFSGTFSYGAWVEVQAVMPSASGYIIHNQGAMGTCYANSMAVVIDAILRNPNLPSSGSSQIAGPGGSGGWISSPLALATNDFVKYYEDKDDKTLNIEREIGYPEILLDSQSTCALGCSASVLDEGGDSDRILNSLIQTPNMPVYFQEDIEGLLESVTSLDLNFKKFKERENASWGGALFSYFEACRNDLGLSKKVNSQSKKGEEFVFDNIDVRLHPAFFSARACIPLLKSLEAAQVRWRVSNLSSVSSSLGSFAVPVDQVITTKSCFPNTDIFDLTSSSSSSGATNGPPPPNPCNAADTQNLTAFVKILSRNTQAGFDSFHAFLKAIARSANASSKLQGYKIDKYIKSAKSKSEFVQMLKASIDGAIPVTYSFDVRSFNSSGSIFQRRGSHSVAIVGYEESGGNFKFLLRNSWGRSAAWNKSGITQRSGAPNNDYEITQDLLYDSMISFEITSK